MDDHCYFRTQMLDLEHQLASLASYLHLNDVQRSATTEEAATQAQCALELCTHLVGASAVLCSASSAPATDVLLARLGGIAHDETRPSVDELTAKLPWLLRAALDLLLEEDIVDTRPGGSIAIAARLLAAIVEATEISHDDLAVSEPA